MGERGEFAITVRVPVAEDAGASAKALLDRIDDLFDEAFQGDELNFCDRPGDIKPGQVISWIMVADPEAGKRVAIEVLTRAGLTRGASIGMLPKDENAPEVQLWADPETPAKQSAE
jgi:hypothetical protein